MGIYDEIREGNASISLGGNKSEASQFIPQARKFAEVMQGKLDLGANLGMHRKSTVPLNDHSFMNVTLSPGVTNQTMHIEIVSNPPLNPPSRPGEEIPLRANCPRLPMSRPGARLFTHLYGHDPRGEGGMANNVFNQKKSVKTNPPYIQPTLEQGVVCSIDNFPGDGLLKFYDAVTLDRPFTLMGLTFTNCFLHYLWLGILDPNVYLSFDTTPIPLGMPCDCNFQGDVFTPDPESLGPGNNFAICMAKNFGENCYPNQTFSNSDDPGGVQDPVGRTFLVEGSVMLDQDFGAVDGKLVTDEDGEETTESDSVQGELREFACLSWTTPDNPQGGTEAQMVLLYPSGKCPAAVGFFYGGPDGLRPTTWPGYATSLMCLFTKPCLQTKTGGGEFIPASFSPFFIGANRQALAYAGMRSSATDLGSDQAGDLIDGRSFWFELTGDGFPSGQGIHNGPLLSGGIGAGDLDFV